MWVRLTLLLGQTRRFLKNSFPTGLSLPQRILGIQGNYRPDCEMGRVAEQGVAQRLVWWATPVGKRQTHLYLGFLMKFSKAVAVLFVGFNSLLLPNGSHW